MAVFIFSSSISARDLLNSLMDGGHVLLRNLKIARDPIHQIPAAIQKRLLPLTASSDQEAVFQSHR